MNAIWALAKKDLLLLVRDKVALFWIFAFPLMFALFFGSIFSGEGDDDGGRGALSIAVVDEDHSEFSAGLLQRLAEDKALKLTRVGEGTLAKIEAPALEEARELVQKGKRVAYVRLPAGFGANPYGLFGAGGDSAAAVEVGIDPARRAEGAMLQGALMQAMFGNLRSRFTQRDVLQKDLAAARREIGAEQDMSTTQKLALTGLVGALELFTQQFDLSALGDEESSAQSGGDSAGGFGGGGVKLVDVTREAGKNPRSAFDITFPQALVWSLMSVAMGCAITLPRERSNGTMTRLSLAPIGRVELLAGKALGCFVACSGTLVVLLVFGLLVFGVRFSSPAHLALGLAATAACFTGLMMLMSVMGKTEAAVSGAGMGIMMPMAMLGGGMIPLIAMPTWLIKLSAVSPFRWAISAVEGAAWRGYDFVDMLGPCAVLLGMGAAFFAAGVAIFRRA